MKYHWKDSTLRQITQLVESALAPLVDARVAMQAPDKPATHPKWPLLRLRDERGKVTTLAVLPWTEAAKRPRDHPPLWVLQRAAKRIHDQLRLRDENFVDTSGVVRLHLPGILVDRSDLKPPTVRGAPEVRNPYSDKNSLLTRALLTSSHHTWLSLQQLAAIAGIPLSSASYVIKALERSGFVGTKRTSSGLEVTLLDPLGLIVDWTRQYDWTRNPAVTFAAPVGSPERFLDRLTKAM